MSGTAPADRKPDTLRILEIGDDGFFHGLRPNQTTWVWTNSSKVGEKKGDPELRFSFRLLRRLLKRITDGEFDLIILLNIKTRLWRRDRSILHNLIGLLRRFFREFHSFAQYLVLFVRPGQVPVVVVDIMDFPKIGIQNHFLFPKIACFFKREIPQNNWNVFLYTSRRNEDLPNIQRQPLLREGIRKLRPFPITVQELYSFPEIRPEDKSTDLFFTGLTERSTVRTTGLKVVQKLKDLGLRVDLPTERLSREEFYRRLSSSWLAWSPEGMGWECYRHHESFMRGTVPVMNYPSIQRYKPFIEGEHCFYYGCEEDDLIRVVTRALSDKTRLLEMVRQGREHLQRWYTTDVLLGYIWNEVSEQSPKHSG